MESRHGVDKALDQLIAETESLVSNDSLLFQQETQQDVSQSSHSTQMTSTAHATDSLTSSVQSSRIQESPAEACRRSFEEAELEALALETHSNASFSKQSSIVETASVQSFVYHKEEKESTESESSFQGRKPLRSTSTSFIRTPETFTKSTPPSAPCTPMSQRRRLRINQSPKPPEERDQKPKYREGSSSPFQPGFYRPPPEETNTGNPIFKLIRRNNSRTNLVPKDPPAAKESSSNPVVRVSQTSSKAYDGDSES